MGWIRENITGWLPSGLGVDIVLVAGRDGKPVAIYGTRNLDHDVEVTRALRGETVSGIQGYSQGIYLMVAMPIVHTDGSGPPCGCLLIGRLVDGRYLAGLEKVVGSHLAVSWQGTYSPSSSFSRAIPQPPFAGAGDDPGPVRLGDEFIVARTDLRDARGQNAVTVYAASSRVMFNTTLKNISGIAAAMAWAVILAVLLAKALQVIAIRPLSQLECGISSIREKKAFERLDEAGPTEVASLARAFNEMAASLEEHMTKNAALTALSYTDPVTGLYNYRYFHEYLSKEIERAKRHLKPLALGLLDVNYFKYYNSTFGHARGDELLHAVAAIITEAAAGRAILSRYAGDDFGLVFPDMDASSCRQTLQETAAKIEQFPFYGRDLLPNGRATVSFGVSVFPDDGTTKEALIRSAQMDLNLSKTTGIGRALRYFNAFTSVLRPGGDPTDLLASAQVLLAIIDSVDRYTYWHTQRVVRYTGWIASRMGLDPSFVENLRLASFLHDVGKIEIDREILTKAGALNAEEWSLMKMHPTWGAGMVRPVERLTLTAPVIETHHERYDGKGYPNGIAADDIPLGARIIAVADAFDAMTTDRPYRKASRPEEALAELQRYSGSQFDPRVVDTFVSSANDPTVMQKLFDEPSRRRQQAEYA
ncbi:MAG: diguanylate cyclase [Firmicutes bacterium]|nr:diguanylate cyclase [Bacillota bacterium]